MNVNALTELLAERLRAGVHDPELVKIEDGMIWAAGGGSMSLRWRPITN